METKDLYIHPTADVHLNAQIGEGTKIWNWVQVREGAVIGRLCILSKGVYIDKDVQIGDFVKIQNNATVYSGVTIEDGVFIGPHVCFTNDLYPRAVNERFEPASEEDWQKIQTLVERGASIGANSTILAGRTIGEYALIGAGSVVTKDIPEYILAVGNPARAVGEVDKRGRLVSNRKNF
ncbi:acetyltransferase [candidate division WWE3 bacterium RIFCSPHIGHO2_01_FULL_42_13]|uniref:Acetyltransferase n=1 Tax=candidate division WWE3 bacterium RIFCSPHIGHO2_01_FULL_42_13 TaxID=1802617 RepID=A0A1F4UQ11_UNCKA|nr:MAG: acetyltransferase [candidate division WWE3 bacterium RIFCSPHIGHO2_01_FULL_42_13]